MDNKVLGHHSWRSGGRHRIQTTDRQQLARSKHARLIKTAPSQPLRIRNRAPAARDCTSGRMRHQRQNAAPADFSTLAVQPLAMQVKACERPA